MDLVACVLVGLVVGVLLGVAVASWLTRQSFAVELAGISAERDLLAQRVIDLEGAAGQDLELAGVLAPLGASLSRIEQQVHSLELDRLEQFARLDAQVGTVASTGEALRQQTAELVGALRSSSARGAWGEVQLRRVLELSGLLSRVDFDQQVSARTADGRVARPDVVVRLPGDKVVVVDAKAPLTAFLEAYAEGLDDDARRDRLRAHARALRGHVDELAGRDYPAAFGTSPEFTVCFVPGESMLSAALDADPSLHEHALGRGVVLVGPSALVALLRTVAFTWQQDTLAGNARELFDVGRELHRRLGQLGGHSAKLGRTLHRAVEDYNALVGTLERRVLVTARRMTDLGLGQEQLPLLEPVEAGPRPLTATELLDDLDGLDPDSERAARRPPLVDAEPTASSDPTGWAGSVGSARGRLAQDDNRDAG